MGIRPLFTATLGFAICVALQSNHETRTQRGPASTDERDSASCDQKSGPITAEDSSNLEYFKTLLNHGDAAPIEDFLKLWYPEKQGSPEAETNPYIFACESIPWGVLVPEANGYLSEACSPDVLYSWGPREKVTSFAQYIPDGALWTGPMNAPVTNTNHAQGSGTVYATFSAIATFGYGTVPIRIKIKPSAQYRSTTSAGASRNGEVAFYSENNWHDYYLSDASVVESWSFGTPEHYDEIVRDALRIASGKRALAYTGEPNGKKLDRLWQLSNYDNHVSDAAHLKKALRAIIQMIVNGEGQIHYSKGTCRNRKLHFKTDKPTYINPFKD